MPETSLDIPYARELGHYGLGDLMIPADSCRGCVLLIHGGGWTSFSKERMGGVATFLAENGYASFSINYPLIQDSPWPASLDACLKAGHFLQETLSNRFPLLQNRPLFILGASAGGHLALMTGLRMTGLCGVISVAGISDLESLAELAWFAELVPAFFAAEQPAKEMFQKASPLYSVTVSQPPLFISHDHNDQVVPFSQAEALVRKVLEVGNTVDFYPYSGPGHVMWLDPALPQPRFLPGIEKRLLNFLEESSVA